MIEIKVTKRNGTLAVECGFTCSGKDLVVETSAAIATIAARVEREKPGHGAIFRELLMEVLSEDGVWDPSLVYTPEDRGAMQS